MKLLMALLGKYRCWRESAHIDRRLRKGEVPDLPLPDSAYRICERCGRLRAVNVRRPKLIKEKENASVSE